MQRGGRFSERPKRTEGTLGSGDVRCKGIKGGDELWAATRSTEGDIRAQRFQTLERGLLEIPSKWAKSEQVPLPTIFSSPSLNLTQINYNAFYVWVASVDIHIQSIKVI